MEYKYTIHISEDLAQHEEAVRKILAFDDNFQGEEDDYLLQCENWFQFKRFIHPGEAIAYYDSEKIFPDLKIQDIDFTEIKNKKDVPEQFRKNTSGIIEIEYVLRMLEEQKSSKACLFIPYSGKLEDSLIVDALNKTGWLEKTITKIEEVVKSRILKDNQPILKLRITEALKNLAKHYFEKLDEGERNRIKELVQLMAHTDWKGYIVNFETFDFHLRYMLIGFGDIEKLSLQEIKEIINALLTESQVDIRFSGIKWNPGGECSKSLKEYLADSKEYQKRKKTINLKALDLLLDIIKIREVHSLDSGEEISLFGRNNLYKIGHHSRKHDWIRIFLDKLVGRRVLIALSEMDDFSSSELFAICLLISKGNTGHLNKRNVQRKSKTGTVSNIISGDNHEERSFVANTINKDLGLFRDDNKVLVADGLVLVEEMSFVNAYAQKQILGGLRLFLDNFPKKLKYLGTFGVAAPEYFLDLTSFHDYVFSVQRKVPQQVKTLLMDIDNYIASDEKYKEVRRILGMGNSLFL